MLCGHYSAAFALKAAHPGARLAPLFFAVQAADVAFFLLVLGGVEKLEVRAGQRGPLAMELVHMPWSHSLVSTLGVAGLLMLIAWATRSVKLGLVMAAAWVSHWLLDLPVHLSDLPIGLGGQVRVGLGLWRIPVASFALETALLAAAYGLLRRRLSAGPARKWTDGLCVAMILLNAVYYAVPGPRSPWLMALGAELLYAGLIAVAAVVDAKERAPYSG
jgi:hypothetical protein